MNLIAIGKQYLNGRVCWCHSVKGIYMCPTDTRWFQVPKRESQNVPNSTLLVPSLFAIPVLLRCNQVYEFWLDQWFPHIIWLVFTLNQRSKNSKNWAKVPTINCGFLTWLFHENHQFLETERINFYVLLAVLFSQLFCVGQSTRVRVLPKYGARDQEQVIAKPSPGFWECPRP